MQNTTYIKNTTRGALLATFSDLSNLKCELTIANHKQTHITAKRLANKSTRANVEDIFRQSGWKIKGNKT